VGTLEGVALIPSGISNPLGGEGIDIFWNHAILFGTNSDVK